MSDDRHDDTNEPKGNTEGGEPVIPGGESTPESTPPLVTPSPGGGPPVPPTPPPSSGSAPSKPADYYAQPPASTEGKKGCGKWAVGCGVAGCLVGVLLIAALVWGFRSGWPMLMSRMVTEVERHIEDNGDSIDPAVREELDVELEELRRHIEDRDLALQDMEGIVYSIQDIVNDDDITTDEAEEFLEELREVNELGASGEF